MKKILSHSLKILSTIFIIGVIFVMFVVLPIMADQGASDWPEIAYIKIPMLIMCEILFALLGLTMVDVFYLLTLYDKGKVFDNKFIKGLEVIVSFCVVALVFIFVIFYWLRKLGGPGPLPSLVLIGSFISIAIFGVSQMLIRSIIIDGMKYKEENDLTV